MNLIQKLQENIQKIEMKRKNNFIDDLVFLKIREELIETTNLSLIKNIKKISGIENESETLGIKFRKEIINGNDAK